MGTWGWAASGYLWAGVGAASLPVLLHILRRRRRRIVRWGPMHLLRQVTVRHRRRWQLRDVGLLILRMLALILFGLALARPYRLGTSVHSSATAAPAVIVMVDNSMSMRAEWLGKTNWERVPEKLNELIDTLPVGSRVCIVPACRQADDDVIPAYESVDRARQLILKWEPLDQGLSLPLLVPEIKSVIEGLPEPPELIYLITDHQRRNGLLSNAELTRGLPRPLQLVPIANPAHSNVWVEEIEMTPQLMVAGDQVTIRVTIGMVGKNVAPQIPVTLWIDDREVATQLVESSQQRNWSVCNFQYTVPHNSIPQNTMPGDSGSKSSGVLPAVLPQSSQSSMAQSKLGSEFSPEFVSERFTVVRATIPQDGLAADDQRATVCPVVARVPLICLETQSGPLDRNDPAWKEASPTYFLRLFWGAMYGDEHPLTVPLVNISAVDREQLRQHQLVVVASERVLTAGEIELLRAFVLEGGQLWLAPAGAFDPAAWNESVWRGGNGILPAPLVTQPLGVNAAEDVTVESLLRIDPASVGLTESGGLATSSGDGMAEMVAELLMFRAVGCDVSSLPTNSETAATNSESATTTKSASASADLQLDHDSSWGTARVLARTSHGVPIGLYRPLGAGGVLFWGTGFTPDWSTMPGSNAVVCWEHIGRFLLSRGLSRPLFRPDEVPRIQLRRAVGSWDWRLIDVTRGEPLAVEVRQSRADQGRYVEVRSRLPRGNYLLEGQNRVSDRQIRLPLVIAPSPATWETSESNLEPMDEVTWSSLRQALLPTGREANGEVFVGAPQRDSFWQYLLGGVLLCLGIESLLCWYRPADSGGVAAG